MIVIEGKKKDAVQCSLYGSQFKKTRKFVATEPITGDENSNKKQVQVDNVIVNNRLEKKTAII